MCDKRDVCYFCMIHSGDKCVIKLYKHDYQEAHSSPKNPKNSKILKNNEYVYVFIQILKPSILIVWNDFWSQKNSGSASIPHQ